MADQVMTTPDGPQELSDAELDQIAGGDMAQELQKLQQEQQKLTQAVVAVGNAASTLGQQSTNTINQIR